MCLNTVTAAIICHNTVACVQYPSPLSNRDYLYQRRTARLQHSDGHRTHVYLSRSPHPELHAHFGAPIKKTPIRVQARHCLPTAFAYPLPTPTCRMRFLSFIATSLGVVLGSSRLLKRSALQDYTSCMVMDEIAAPGQSEPRCRFQFVYMDNPMGSIPKWVVAYAATKASRRALRRSYYCLLLC
eukprot:SAG11_NODE_1517_length_4764_cov_7.382637_5_plen_184_part_00